LFLFVNVYSTDGHGLIGERVYVSLKSYKSKDKIDH